VPDICYYWSPTVNGTHVFDTCGDNSFDTVLSIHSEDGSTEHACSDDDGSCSYSAKSELSFNATVGQTYMIVIDGYYSDDHGSYTLNIEEPAGGSCDNDNTCDTGAGENCSSCPGDCGACGSGGCNGSHCDYSFCSSSCPCTYGQADCDSDAECVSGLVCGWEAAQDFGCDPVDELDACVPIGEATGGYCGDDTCDSGGDEDESSSTCPEDCP
jgi:hypothetical protein